MHESILSLAMAPDEPLVMRLALKPYSIGHEILLDAIASETRDENLFRSLPEWQRRASLMSAAIICSRSWRQHRESVRWARLWMFFNQRLDLKSEAEKFFRYREAGSVDLPLKRMPRQPGGVYHYFGSPALARLILFIQRSGLFRDLGFSTLYDVPLSLAKVLYSTELEATGSIWIKNFTDYENEARARAHEKQHPEGTVAVGDDAVRKLAEKWNRDHPNEPFNVDSFLGPREKQKNN